MIIRVDIKPVAQIIQENGLAPGGDVQRFHTNNVMRRIQKYMPYRTGATIKMMIAQTDTSKPEIVLDVPYAKYLYYGKAMEGRAPKRVTDRDLVYTKTKNQHAGPFWDRSLVAAEGDAMAEDVRRYLKWRRK